MNVGFPWMMPHSANADPTMVAIRRLAYRQLWSDKPWLARLAAKALATMSWPFTAMFAVLQCRVWLWGDEEFRASFRISKAYWAALRHNIHALEFANLKLWLPERWAMREDYLYAREWSYAHDAFRRGPDVDAIHDKLAFFEFCEENGFPTIPVLASVEPNGTVSVLCEPSELERDVFLKPRRSFAGRGAELWKWDGSCYRSQGAGTTIEGFVGYLAEYGKRWGGAVLQPVVASSTPFVGKDFGGLCVIRCVTAINDIGEFDTILLELHIPEENAIISQEGEAYPICNSNGLVSGLTSPISIPDFKHCTQLATSAHAKIEATQLFLGWDIVYVNEKWQLMETNSGWQGIYYQIESGQPLDMSPFANRFRTRLAETVS